jgi:hypothetical protein
MGISPAYAYYRLGTEQGGNIGLWRYAISLQADRVREAVVMERDVVGDLRHEAAMQLDADAHFLLVAVRNGLRFVDELQTHIADAGLATALTDFAKRFPDAADFRDVLTHIDDYILDRGRLQQKGAVDPGSSSYRWTTKDGEVRYGFGPFVVPLLATAEAAGNVMALADAAWLQGLRDNVDGLDQPAAQAPTTT